MLLQPTSGTFGAILLEVQNICMMGTTIDVINLAAGEAPVNLGPLAIIVYVQARAHTQYPQCILPVKDQPNNHFKDLRQPSNNGSTISSTKHHEMPLYLMQFRKTALITHLLPVKE